MALSLVALLPGFLILIFTQYQINYSRHLEIQDLAVRSARQASFELDRIVASVGILLISVSHEPDVRSLNDKGCGSYMEDLRSELPYLTGLSVLDLQGRFRCGFPLPEPGKDSFAERGYFREALDAKGAVVGDYTIRRVTGRPVLPIAIALRNETGGAQAVLVATLDLDWLGEKLKDRGLPPGGSLTIADKTGVIIARHPLPERFVGTKIPDPYMRLLTAPHPGWEEVMSQDGTRRVLGYMPLSEPPVGLYVSVGLSAETSYGPINRAARMDGVLAIACALATLFATWVLGSRIFVHPIREITGVLQIWRAGDRSARTHYPAGSGELGELGSELDRLMNEISRSEEQRALLAGELEHRVKNTLATVQAIAVSTMKKDASGRELLPDFLTRLTALARTHEVLTRERWDNADLRELLFGVFQPLIGDIAARVSLKGPDISLPPREALGMTMVLHELCTNALKYGSLGSSSGNLDLTWLVSDRKEGRQLEMTWREKNGPIVKPPKGNTGFGTRMIDRALGGFGQTSIEFDSAGLICRIEITLAEAAGLPRDQFSLADT